MYPLIAPTAEPTVTFAVFNKRCLTRTPYMTPERQNSIANFSCESQAMAQAMTSLKGFMHPATFVLAFDGSSFVPISISKGDGCESGGRKDFEFGFKRTAI